MQAYQAFGMVFARGSPKSLVGKLGFLGLRLASSTSGGCSGKCPAHIPSRWNRITRHKPP